MKIQLKHGLPIVSLTLTHNNHSVTLPNVLFDTGCAATVFDTEALAEIEVYIDFINGKAKRMYGVGGTSETCYEQISQPTQPIARHDSTESIRRTDLSQSRKPR